MCVPIPDPIRGGRPNPRGCLRGAKNSHGRTMSTRVLAHEQAMALKQQCNAADVRAKLAELDRDLDGYLVREELPPEHQLSSRFKEVDLDRDQRLSLTEVAEFDAETDPVKGP